MKKLFLYTMIYEMVVSAIVPLLYFAVRGGYILLYSDCCPNKYIFQAAGLIIVTTLLICVIICVLPCKKVEIETIEGEKCVWIYCATIFLFNLIKFMCIGEFTNHNVINGTWLGYFTYFMDFNIMIIVCVLMVRDNIFCVWECILFLISSILFCSRAGLFYLFYLVLALLILTKKYTKYRIRLCIALLIMCLCAPGIYVFSTFSRGGGEAGREMSVLDWGDHMMGRVSNLEVLGIALYQKDQNLWNENVFVEKYSLENQSKRIVNQLVIGDVFEEDVQPSQYYRTVFLEVPLQQAHDTYTSINLTLVGYLVLKYGYFIGFILTVLFFVAFYCLVIYIKTSNCIKVFLLSRFTMEVFIFFDWAMSFSLLFQGILTLTCFQLFDFFVTRFLVRKRLC